MQTKSRRRTAANLVLSSMAFATFTWAGTPGRNDGISLHMIPKRVAEAANREWGFRVAYAAHLMPEKTGPVLQSTSDLLSFVRKQDKSVQDNGVWIVTTHPDAYSADEMQLLEDVKALSRRERIPLFIVRASQLPHGWQRYDNAP